MERHSNNNTPQYEECKKKSQVCIHCDCKSRAVFNYEGLFVRLYCADHKLEGMVNVISKRC